MDNSSLGRILDECSALHAHQRDTLRDWEDENIIIADDDEGEEEEPRNPDVE
jgi:hypothetical protein